jgi:hypothetical protein
MIMEGDLSGSMKTAAPKPRTLVVWIRMEFRSINRENLTFLNDMLEKKIKKLRSYSEAWTN